MGALNGSTHANVQFHSTLEVHGFPLGIRPLQVTIWRRPWGKLCTSSEVHITGTELQWRAFPLEIHKTVTCNGRMPWEKRCTSLVYRVIPHLDVGRVVTLSLGLWSILCEYSHHALRGHFRERTVHLFVRFPETDHGVLTPRHTEIRQCLL